MPQLVSVQKIWDYSENNALADLIYFKNQFFCSIRESDEHAGGRDGEIRILSSPDAKNWKAVAIISLRGTDLRDPMLSIMPNGKLLLTMGGSRYKKERCLGCNPCVAFSTNGTDWSDVAKLDYSNEWIWRVTWHKGTGYAISYRNNPEDVDEPWVATLFQTKDAFNYDVITELNVAKNPSEGTIRFLPDNSMVALLRRQGPGMIGHSKPPYTKWKWTDIGFRVGGPNFLILPNGDMWAGSRLLAEEKMRRTTLAKMSSKTYEPVLVLPSGGDTSYPGLVYRDGHMYMCYYSSHEDKTNVYLATIKLDSKMADESDSR